MPTRDHLHVIEMSMLADVIGGAARKSVSGSNPQVTAALQQLTSSLDDLKSSQKNQGSSVSQMLPMLLMAKLARERG